MSLNKKGASKTKQNSEVKAQKIKNKNEQKGNKGKNDEVLPEKNIAKNNSIKKNESDLKGNDLDKEKYNNQKAKVKINKIEKMEEKGKINDSKTNSKETSNKDNYGKTNSHGNSNSYGHSYDYYRSKEKYKGIFGFSNNKLMNNCFMNSSLQNLLHCETFKALLHSIQDKNLSNKPLTREVKSLITQINNGEDDLDPRNIKSILSDIEEKYKYNEQNDANEFITIFLGELLKELKGIGEYKTENIPKDELEKKAFNKLEDKFFNKNKSLLLNLFYGRLKRQYICENDHICDIKFNNFNTLILPHPEKSNKLYDLLNLYQKRKMISDTIFCNKCQKESSYSIETKIYNIPKYFIICLEKETAYHSKGIKFPILLKTTEFMETPCQDYYLNSLIEYSGNRESGHYTAKVRQDNKWFSISDSYYRKIDESEILYNQSAIILFYSID